MMAFVVAGLIFFGTLIGCAMIIGEGMMGSGPSSNLNPAPVFYVGMILSGLILASHWIPNIGW